MRKSLSAAAAVFGLFAAVSLIDAAVAQIPPSAAMRLPAAAPRRSWVSPDFARLAATSGVIYVTDASTGGVDIYTQSIPNQLVGIIVTDLCFPEGVAVDPAGKLYVSSLYAECASAGPTITIFAPGATTPSKIIIDGMYDPFDVAVSALDGTLYASDVGNNVLEYARNQTTLRRIVYPLGARPTAIALDASDTLFAAYSDLITGAAHVGRYDPTTAQFVDLGIPLQLAGGIAIDKLGNLLVSDQRTGVVSVYPPGSNTPIKTFAGYGDPIAISLNDTSTMLYVADTSNHFVDELAYPSGREIGRIAGFRENIFGVAVGPTNMSIPERRTR